MSKRILSTLKSLLKPLLLVGLVLMLVFNNADGALAAGSGGRVGGGSFRAPSRSYSMPSRSYSSRTGGYYAPSGGGFGFPFILPFFGFGGGFGGLFTILIVIAVANFLMQALRRSTDGDGSELLSAGSNNVSVAQLQVGLLAGARTLQADLDRIAQTADTNSASGRAQVLQETTLSLLRHPEYWAYAGTTASQKLSLAAAETQFNRLALTERSKFTQETLSNVNGQRQLSTTASAALLEAASDNKSLDNHGSLAEYIVVTILVGAQGDLKLPKVNTVDDLRQAISQIGSVPADRLMALEILWTPQQTGDTLGADDLLAEYSDLRLI